MYGENSVDVATSLSMFQETRMCPKGPPVQVDSALPDQKGATLLPACVVMLSFVPGTLGSIHLCGSVFIKLRPAECCGSANSRNIYILYNYSSKKKIYNCLLF